MVEHVSRAHVLHPEHFVTPMLGGSFANSLETRSSNFIQKIDLTTVPSVSVVIRTRNDEQQLESLFEDFADQDGNTDTQYIVVDTESTDRTAEVARYCGAHVISISQSEFNYPKALNIGFERAENPVVFSTVGHAALSTDVSVAAGASHLTDGKMGGVFMPPLPANWASRTERWASLGNAGLIKEAKRLKKAGMGVMGATNAMFSRAAWEELEGFDEKFAAGGEDTDLARRMIAEDFDIVREPLLAVHHAHGLGPINYARQVRHWAEVLRGPGSFDTDAVAKRRPDLALE